MGGWLQNVRLSPAVFPKAEMKRKLWKTSRKPLPLGYGPKIRKLYQPSQNSRDNIQLWSLYKRIGKLGNISGKEAVKAFKQAGWQAIGQVGSHLVMVKPDVRVNLSIPQHKELSVGTLRALIRNAGLTVDEFLALL